MNIQIPENRILHIVGPRKSGKTSLLEFLIAEFRKRGIKVAALKHSSHDHSLDKSGSDSDRLRKAGANLAIFVTPEGFSVFGEDPTGKVFMEISTAIFKNHDLVLVESNRTTERPKIVLAESADDLQGLMNVIAVVSENPLNADVPVFKPDDNSLVDFILKTTRPA